MLEGRMHFPLENQPQMSESPDFLHRRPRSLRFPRNGLRTADAVGAFFVAACGPLFLPKMRNASKNYILFCTIGYRARSGGH
jgi:hypothetical protein